MSRSLAVCYWLVLLVTVASSQRLQAQNLDCLTCHSAPGFREARSDGREVSLHVDSEIIAKSVHARLQCLDCHADFRGEPLPHRQSAKPVQCVQCHKNNSHAGAPNASIPDIYADSVHGHALKKGDPDSPECKTCHGTHDIRPASDRESTTYRSNISRTCGQCHFDTGLVKRHKIGSVSEYKNSIHSKMVERTDKFETAAVCTDCHGVHNIKASGKADSPVNRLHVPETCGKCHEQALADYKKSIHGKASAKGIKNAPVCTDCHGEHNIDRPSSAESPVNPAHIVATCSKCHEDTAIQRKYGLPANRLSSYISSYHGVANKYGDITVANCATCHSAHKVLPSSDPESSVNKKNLPQTCGKCHPGAGKNFAEGSIHVVPSPRQDVIVFWVRTFYTVFVIGLIASFCGYILLDLRARWMGRLPWRRGDR